MRGRRDPAVPASPIARAGVVRLALGVVAVLVGGCAPAAPSAVPSAAATPATARPELAWSRAAMRLPDDVVQVAPGTSPDIQCSPCHAVQASLMNGVAATPDGLLAVGVQLPPAEAVAYRSTDDGRTWAAEPRFASGDGTAANAVAAGAGGRVAVVGRDGAAAAAWLRDPGGSWTAISLPSGVVAPGSAASSASSRRPGSVASTAPGPGPSSAAGSAPSSAPGASAASSPAGGPAPAAMAEARAVVAWRDGFVAVGTVDAAGGTGAAWASPDGTTWARSPDEAPWAHGEAYGVAAAPDLLVAVGDAGAEGAAPTGDAAGGMAWVSEDAVAWTRVVPAAFAGAHVRAVAWTGGAFVAVGYARADDRAMAWTSPDGRAWTASPASPGLANHGRAIRMLGVTAAPDGGLVAVGWQSDAGNGSGAIWTSADGIGWTRLPDQVSVSGGSLSGVVATAAGPVAVGTSGYPDNDQASAWYPAP